jgi:hypothetical protein
MAKRLDSFPDGASRRYPWTEWTDGGVWEIRRGEDYDAATENMRVNLHMKADALTMKVPDKEGQRRERRGADLPVPRSRRRGNAQYAGDSAAEGR